MFFTTLANNLQVLYLPFPTTSSVFISLKGKAGRRGEQEKEIGGAHFLEHLFFDGIIKRLSASELSKFLDDQGAQHNGLTGTETVNYFVKILAGKAEFGFEYLSDIYFNSLFRGEDIEKERKVIFEEQAMYKDRPEEVLKQELGSLLYPNQILGRKFYDDQKNLDLLTKEILLNYKKRNYVSQNFILTVAGKITKESALVLAEKYFSQFDQGKIISFPKAEIEKEMKIKIINQNLGQSQLAIGFRGYSRLQVQEKIFCFLLRKILTGGHSSRLYRRLRNELHLIYTVHSGLTCFSDIGDFSLETKMKEENLPQTLNEILREIKKLLTGGITGDELQRAKNLLLSDFLFSLEKFEAYVDYFNSQYLFKNEIVSIEDNAKLIKNTSVQQVMSVAEYIFSDKPKICILTPKLKELSLFL